MISLVIDSKHAGQRVDRFLRHHLLQAPLAFIYKGLRQGSFKINDKKVKADYRLHDNDILTFHLSTDEYQQLTAQTPSSLPKKTFEILYEDNDLLIVNKPAGLASQPGTGVERHNLIDQVKQYLRAQGSGTKPALGHRLDRGTSGAVVIGKHRQAILALFTLFKEKRVEKYYLALVHGVLQQRQGTLRCYLQRVKEHFQHKMQIVAGNEEGAVLAEAHYRVVEQTKAYSLLALQLLTGKMHQLRVQLAALGHPIVGDNLYGNKDSNKVFSLRRQFLHAYSISFVHPFTRQRLEITAPLPADLRNALEKAHISISSLQR